MTPAAAATWRYLAQRVTAAMLAVCVLVHLATILYATRQGLSAAAMLARVHASLAWPIFYGAFVGAVAVHAPLGLRVILDEWTALRGRAVDVALALFGITLFVGGVRAIMAVSA